MQTFAASVKGWSEKAKANSEAILKESAQDLAEQVTTPIAQGGNMRVDTGFLRNSLMASTSAMPMINPAARPSEGAQYGFTIGPVAATILSADFGDTIYLGFTASYAWHREEKDGFVRLAGQNWPSIVAANAAKVR